MGLTALDILVLILVAATAVTGALRGFVTEVLSVMAWIFVVFALRMGHTPATAALADTVGTDAGAATLAFVAIAGGTWFLGRLVANAIGARTRNSVLGPIDRALGLGFGMLKGLILASLAFLLLTLVLDTVTGGPLRRPVWMKASRTYPLLDATSASIADFVDRRRRGAPMFDDAPAGNAAAAS